MRSARYWFRFLSAFLARFAKTIIASILLGAIAFLIITRFPGLFSFLQPDRVIGVVGKLTLDDLPQNIQKDLSFGLTKLDENNSPQPGLAASWETEESGKVWIFKLGDHKWQDGSRVAAKDINYRFKDANIEVVDEKTIKFTLKEDPFAPFPTAVSRPVFKKGLVGAGEWKVARLTNLTAQLNKSLTLVNTKTKEKKTYRFYDTEEAVRTAFKLGQIKQIEGIVDPKDLTSWKNISLDVVSHEDRFVGIFLNVQDPSLAGKSLRQALAYAINKERFPEKRVVSVISPNSWAVNPQVKEYKYSIVRAKELLKDTSSDKNQITLATTPSLLFVADKIKEDWEAIGIHTELQVSNTPPKNFQALLAIQIIPPDPDQYSLLHSTQSSTNITGYTTGDCCKESPRIDKKLEEGRKTLDQEERKTIYYEFQRFLLEDLPVIPLFHPVTYTITRK